MASAVGAAMIHRARVWQLLGAVLVAFMTLPALAASPEEGVPAAVLADWTAVLQTAVTTSRRTTIHRLHPAM